MSKLSSLNIKILLGLCLYIIILFITINTYEKHEEKVKRENKVVEWGADIAGANYTLYKSDNFGTEISLQASDKIPSYSTSFYLADDTWLRSLVGGSGSWGYGSTPLGGNDFEQPLPDKVRVTYLDNVANQYYQGEYDLPTDKIYELMTSTDKNMESERPGDAGLDSNYYAIELAFAPNGWVIVFVTGWPGRTEIASFQATPIEPDPKTLEGEPVSSGDEYLYIDYPTLNIESD